MVGSTLSCNKDGPLVIKSKFNDSQQNFSAKWNLILKLFQIDVEATRLRGQSL
jgi:hypothetical protein